MIKKGEWYIKESSAYHQPAEQITDAFFQETTRIKLNMDIINRVDVFFPIIHGTFGEDGTLQGILKFLGKPFVGPDLLASAVCMDKEGANLRIPAEIDEKTAADIQQTAIRAYQTTCCEGMARVDFFLRDNNTFVLNEINTLPGFTEISMYPKLFEYTGITYSDLITKLIDLSIERYEENK